MRLPVPYWHGTSVNTPTTLYTQTRSMYAIAIHTGISVFHKDAPFSVPGFWFCWGSETIIALLCCIFHTAFKPFSGFTFLWVSHILPKPSLSVVAPFYVTADSSVMGGNG